MNRNTSHASPERFIRPQIPASLRTDQLTGLRPRRKLQRLDQGKWLKETLAQRWPEELPQPLIDFDREQENFILEWRSKEEQFTLVIDAQMFKGTFRAWPTPRPQHLEGPLDLESDTPWRLIRRVISPSQP